MSFSRIRTLPTVAPATRPVARGSGGLVTPPIEHAVTRADIGVLPFVAATALAFVVAHWLTRSQYLFDLDSILYARALDHFDLRLTQPALPGYFLYIQLGRVARALVGDANTALVLLSIAFGALSAGAFYLLGRDLYDERTGRIAGLLALTGPIYWYQSSFASPRIAEGFFAAAVVWIGVRARRDGDARFFWVLPVLLAVAGGVRQQTLVYLIPFALWATWKFSWRQRLLAGALCGVGCLAWGIPTLVGAGGLAEYRSLSNAQWQEFVVGETGVMYARSAPEALHRLATSLGQIVLYALYTCIPAPLILLAAARRGLPPRAIVLSFEGQALLFATAPALGFFAFVHLQQIGHFMAVAPFLTLLLARVLARDTGRLGLPSAVGLVVLANLAFICLAPARLIGSRVGTPTVATIRGRDAFIADGIAAIRSTPPDQTLVITSPLSYGFVEAYAPGYQYYLMPGLSSSDTGPAPFTDQRALTNGLQSIPAALHPEPGQVAAPATAHRFVLFSYDVDLTRLVAPSESQERTVPTVSYVGVIQKASPTVLKYRPGRLTFQEVP